MNLALFKAKHSANLVVAFVLLQPAQAQVAHADSFGQLKAGRAVPQWNNSTSRSGHRQSNNDRGFTFNSSLGYLPNSTINTLSSPRPGFGSVIVIQPGNRPTGYEWDRSGNCIETKTDRFGTTYRRKTARQHCNF